MIPPGTDTHPYELLVLALSTGGALFMLGFELGVVFALLVVLFVLALLYRLVVAVERIAERV